MHMWCFRILSIIFSNSLLQIFARPISFLLVPFVSAWKLKIVCALLFELKDTLRVFHLGTKRSLWLDYFVVDYEACMLRWGMLWGCCKVLVILYFVRTSIVLFSLPVSKKKLVLIVTSLVYMLFSRLWSWRWRHSRVPWSVCPVTNRGGLSTICGNFSIVSSMIP